MKTISNLFLCFILALTLASLSQTIAHAQLVCDCEPDVPHFRVVNHPDAPGPNLQGRYIYDYSNDTVYRRTFCGANPFVQVDPCRPWTLEFFGYMSEIEDDCVTFDSVGVSWDTTLCHDLRYEILYPPAYVIGTPADSIFIKFTMISHQADTCNYQDNYYCTNDTGHYIDLDCWVNCTNERISIYGHDACPIPNIALCRIEWDSPLPVELTSFNSTVNGNNVVLNWSTAKEINNSGFEIERHSEGEWRNIGFIAGKGNSSVTTEYNFMDRNLNSGAYSYRLKQVDFNGNFEYFELNGVATIGVPENFSLAQNYPNPFNPSTTIVYGVPENGPVTLKIYDNLGREVSTLVNESKTAGFYTATFSAAELSSGVYFYKLESGKFVSVKRMVLMK